MTDMEEVQEKKGSKKGPILALLAAIGAAAAAFMFWRSRKGSEDEDEMDDE
jgi:hypothetical protein